VTATFPVRSQAPHTPRWLLLAGSVAAGVPFAAFLIGAMGALRFERGSTDNWLVILFKLNFRPTSTSADSLSIVSILDIGLILMFALVMAAMYPGQSTRGRGWPATAVALPLLGIPVFLATETAGRSAVLLAGFISSVLALRRGVGGVPAAITGIVASSLLLFVGDFGTAALQPSLFIALFIAAGYILWTVWLLIISLRLLRRSRHAAA
jgi:hypothetical protein